MKMTPEELTKFIPRVMPSGKNMTVSELKVNDSAQVVTFTWKFASQQIRLVVKPSLEAFEVRPDGKLYVTGSSLLVTSILSGNNSRGNTLEAVLETMKQVEGFVSSNNAANVKNGLELLSAVKKTLDSMRRSLPSKS